MSPHSYVDCFSKTYTNSIQYYLDNCHSVLDILYSQLIDVLTSPSLLLFRVPESPPLSTSASILLHFDLLHFADIMVFYKRKDCGNTALSKSLGVSEPTILANFISLCHNLVIFTIFLMFSFLLLCCEHLWSVIFDITIKIVWGCYEWHP